MYFLHLSKASFIPHRKTVAGEGTESALLKESDSANLHSSWARCCGGLSQDPVAVVCVVGETTGSLRGPL